nr:DUF6318 family protein [Ornithinimicrobium sp. F0845]
MTLVAVAALLAGCQGNAEPADPPTSQDALTTTSDPEPTTQAPPPDDVDETSSPPDDVVETTDAGGPPTLPDEAKEDSEAGAEAFALHYIELINYTSRHPEVGLLEPLATDNCEACENHEASVAYSAEHKETIAQNLFEVSDSVSLHNPTDSVANIRVEVAQVGQDVVDQDGQVVDRLGDHLATMSFSLVWDGGWKVEDLRAELHQS